MKKVYAAPNLALAHHLKALLEEVGIPALVRGQHLDAGTAAGLIPIDLSTLPSVWVLDDDHFDLALPLVHDFDEKVTLGTNATAATGASHVSCGSCGESVDAHFTVCWNCGSDLAAGEQAT